MMKNKQCLKCLKIYPERPKSAKLHLEALPSGYYFNCECGSTLVWPVRFVKFDKLN